MEDELEFGNILLILTSSKDLNKSCRHNKLRKMTIFIKETIYSLSKWLVNPFTHSFKEKNIILVYFHNINQINVSGEKPAKY